MSEGEQPIVYHPEPQSNVGKWILIVLAVAYAGASAFFITTSTASSKRSRKIKPPAKSKLPI